MSAKVYSTKPSFGPSISSLLVWILQIIVIIVQLKWQIVQAQVGLIPELEKAQEPQAQNGYSHNEVNCMG